MFEIMLGEVPEAMRDVFRGKLTAVLAQKAQGGPATEDHVSSIVMEIVPEPFKSAILKKFKELGDFDIKVIDQIIEKQGTSQDRLMYILHDIQDEVGYLPAEALRAVSNKTGISLSTIYNVATFYKTFRLTKPGKHHVKICCGTACHINDKAGIAQQVEAKAGASAGVSLEKTLCMGCCDCSPAIEIDGRVYTGEEAKAKIETLA
jgi:NADH:ubiquinone oxidoreductase subunit E